MSKNEKKEGFVLGLATAAAAFAGYYLFGPKGKENQVKVKGWTLKAKGEVLEKLEKLEVISEEKYTEIIDQVVAKYEKLKTTTEAETRNLKNELQSRYAHVKRDIKKAEKDTTKKVTKVRAKLAKKVAPKNK